MNGIYKVSISTPMGQQTGTLSLLNENGVLSGYILALGNKNPIRNGKAKENSFEFDGNLRTFIGYIEYTAKGTIIDEILQATAQTKYGTIQIKGTRMQVL